MDTIFISNNNLSYVDSKIAIILVLILIFYYIKCGLPIKESWPWDNDDDDVDNDDNPYGYEGAGLHGGVHALKLQDRDDDVYNKEGFNGDNYDYDYDYDDEYDDDYDYDYYNYDEYEGAGLYGGGHALKIQTSDQTSVGSHNHTGDPDYLNYNALL